VRKTTAGVVLNGQQFAMLLPENREMFYVVSGESFDFFYKLVRIDLTTGTVRFGAGFNKP